MNIVEKLHKFYIFDILAFSNKAGELDARFRSYGGEIYTVEIPRYPRHPFGCFFAYQKLYTKVKQICQEKHYDVIHGHSGPFDGICLLAARRSGIMVRISHGHGAYVWSGRNFLVKYYLELGKLMILKHATKRLACSNIAGETLFLNHSYANVLNPVDISYYKDIEKKTNDTINLLQIGYFEQRKNQLFSLRLLKCLRENSVNAELFLIGYPHEAGYKEKMEQVIDDGNLWEHVSFLPHDFDKREAFAKADYCLLPSESEGLPLVALESQAAGVPCLMSDNISRDSDVGAGFFLPHDNLQKWADLIINGVEVDKKRLEQNLKTISTRAYAEKIRTFYEQNTEKG